MKVFINLFLTIIPLAGILFSIISIIYFSTNFELDQAIKLGIIAGVLIGLVFSILMSIFLLIMRKIRIISPIAQKVKVKKETIIPINVPTEKQVMLFMDKELAFEVSLRAIADQDIGNVTNNDKGKGSIDIRTLDEGIAISISALTKHTSEIKIKASAYSKKVQQIIDYLKIKEYSFMDY